MNQKHKKKINRTAFSRTVQFEDLSLESKNNEFGGIINYGGREVKELLIKAGAK